MLYREIIAVCSQIHTKHKYAVWAERRISPLHTGCRSRTYPKYHTITHDTSQCLLNISIAQPVTHHKI